MGTSSVTEAQRDSSWEKTLQHRVTKRCIDPLEIPVGEPRAAVVRDLTVQEVMRWLPGVRDQLYHVGHLLQMVVGYVPALLILGTSVRDCHYMEGWDVGSGKVVHGALLSCMNLMLRVDPLEKALQGEYFRSLLYALCSWTPVHNAVPMACYSEDPCEALLAQLGRSARRCIRGLGLRA